MRAPILPSDHNQPPLEGSSLAQQDNVLFLGLGMLLCGTALVPQMPAKQRRIGFQELGRRDVANSEY